MNRNTLNGGGYLFPAARLLGATLISILHGVMWLALVAATVNCACESRYSYNKQHLRCRCLGASGSTVALIAQYVLAATCKYMYLTSRVRQAKPQQLVQITVEGIWQSKQYTEDLIVQLARGLANVQIRAMLSCLLLLLLNDIRADDSQPSTRVHQKEYPTPCIVV